MFQVRVASHNWCLLTFISVIVFVSIASPVLLSASCLHLCFVCLSLSVCLSCAQSTYSVVSQTAIMLPRFFFYFVQCDSCGSSAGTFISHMKAFSPSKEEINNLYLVRSVSVVLGSSKSRAGPDCWRL